MRIASAMFALPSSFVSSLPTRPPQVPGRVGRESARARTNINYRRAKEPLLTHQWVPEQP